MLVVRGNEKGCLLAGDGEISKGDVVAGGVAPLSSPEKGFTLLLSIDHTTCTAVQYSAVGVEGKISLINTGMIFRFSDIDGSIFEYINTAVQMCKAMTAHGLP